jgi:hypothetical protein
MALSRNKIKGRAPARSNQRAGDSFGNTAADRSLDDFSITQENSVNVEAAVKLGRLHDALQEVGYAGQALEMLLARLLFCLFAEDTAILERNQFHDYLETRTAPDGSNLGSHLTQVFQMLGTPPTERLKNLDPQLASFPFVNDWLFAEMLPLAVFDHAMRDMLLDCCALDWSRISPATCCSLLLSVVDVGSQRHQGAHFTAETDILKVLRPLFLDALAAEFKWVRGNHRQLATFQRRLAAIRMLDPACGCGNFLAIAYRELRLLELAVLQELYSAGDGSVRLPSERNRLALVNVDQFHGIELDEFSACIARVALWMTDHQMNLRASEVFGQHGVRPPLAKVPNIIHGSALTLDWRGIVRPEDLSYIVGNPPFVGARLMTSPQRAEAALVFRGAENVGLLDYVACWYRKAVDYMAGYSAIRAAFVSTPSITQGEQAGVLWPDLFQRGVRINFAHRAFQWSSTAVHGVIVGFALRDEPEKWLFDYDRPDSEPRPIQARNISPYLVDGPDLVLVNRQRPICAVPGIGIGSKPLDGGHYLFTAEEKAEFLAREPQAAPWFRPWVGVDEFLNGSECWCLWLGECSPEQLREMPEAKKRVEAVQRLRLSRKSAPTLKLAETPTRLFQENIPNDSFLLILKTPSERWVYIPIGYMRPETLANELMFLVPHSNLYQFGVLSSTMHMAWVRAVCDRLEGRYLYSPGMVYNNFPWPEPYEPQRRVIEIAAQGVLDARARFASTPLADLYDPLAMPPELVEAHQALDHATDAAYGGVPFAGEAKRVGFLFERYREMVSLLPVERPSRKNGRKIR